jgi:hypothetical protein
MGAAKHHRPGNALRRKSGANPSQESVKRRHMNETIEQIRFILTQQFDKGLITEEDCINAMVCALADELRKKLESEEK